MKEQCKKIGIGHGIVLALAVILLVFSYMIPTQQMKGHVLESVGQYVQEGEYPSVFDGTVGRLDNYSEAIMVSTAITGSQNAWSDAFQSSSYICKKNGERPVDALIEQVTGSGNVKIKLRNYTRYWHGYVIFLKPMLYFFNLQELKILAQLGFGMMFGIVFLLIWKKTDWKMAVSFLLSMLLAGGQVVPYSLQYLNMFLLTLTGMLVLLLFYDTLQKKDAFYVFFWIMGMCTGFFDLLTTPVLVIGMLLILKIVLDKAGVSLWQSILQGVCWGGGYASMWAAKWVIGSLVLRKNIIADAVNKVADRTSGEALGTEVGVSEVAGRIVELYTQPFMKKMLAAAVLFVLLAVLIAFFKDKKKETLANVRGHYVLLLISLIPVVWLAVLRNHTFIHYWFTYRNMAVFFWGILAYAAALSGPTLRAEKRIKERE